MSTFHAFNFDNQCVLMRVDFNVPMDKQMGTVRDDTRLRAALPSLKKILSTGGRVVLMSHLGRPKGVVDQKLSLRPLCAVLEKLLAEQGVHTKVYFAEACIGGEVAQKVRALKKGEILLLENLRFHAQEEKGDRDFAQALSKHGDVYVLDAFGTAHRAHASTAVVADFFAADKKFFGYLMEAELQAAAKILDHPERPLCVILGGAKVSDKLPLIENLLDKADTIIIGGGMAYTFLKARGERIGGSLCEEDKLTWAREVMARAKAKGTRLILPEDSVATDHFAAPTTWKNVHEIPDGFLGVDIGEASARTFAKEIKAAKTILWNGPMGVFENEHFAAGTRAVAQAVAQSVEAGAYALVGGGDSVAAVHAFEVADKISYISTGGGALLELFEGKKLPGVVAIQGK